MFNLRDFFKGWDQFFFLEKPTYNLAFFRIAWGTLIFFNILFELGNVEDFYGPKAMVSNEYVNTHFNYFHFSLFKVFQNTVYNAYGIYFFTLIALFLVIIGLFTRAALFGAFIGIVSLHMRNVWILSSADVLLRCILVILVWSPCANVLSLDSYFARKKGKPLSVTASQWTWRMLQIQISVVYVWTAWEKLKGNTWFDGSAVYYATRLDTMKNVTLPWVLDNKFILVFSTWATVAVEFALGTLIWFKRFRTPVVISGILLHLGIELVMAIPFFEWMMICLLMNFYTPTECLVFYNRIHSKVKNIISHSMMDERIRFKALRLLEDIKPRVN